MTGPCPDLYRENVNKGGRGMISLISYVQNITVNHHQNGKRKLNMRYEDLGLGLR